MPVAAVICGSAVDTVLSCGSCTVFTHTHASICHLTSLGLLGENTKQNAHKCVLALDKQSLTNIFGFMRKKRINNTRAD